MKKQKLPTLKKVERAIDWPAPEWAGNCYAVACKIVEAGLVKGIAVYGHFTGKIHPKSYFGMRAGGPFVQHGWVLLDDGRVLDPTRWTFEAMEPYLHVGPLTGEYDEGGNQWRRATVREPPDFDPEEPLFELTKRVLPTGDAWTLIEKLLKLNDQYTEPNHPGPGWITRMQLFWIANLPMDILGEHAPEIYEAFERLDVAAAVPMDNRRKAQRMKGRGP